jgi:hypothetical protein
MELAELRIPIFPGFYVQSQKTVAPSGEEPMRNRPHTWWKLGRGLIAAIPTTLWSSNGSNSGISRSRKTPRFRREGKHVRPSMGQ